MTNYNYNISLATLNNKVDMVQLNKEIVESSITIALASVSAANDNLDINFKAPLSTEEETLLVALLSSHTGASAPDKSVVKYEEVIPQGGDRVSDKGIIFTATAGTTTSFDYTVTSDLFVKDGHLIAYDFHRDDVVSMSIAHPVSGQDIHLYLDSIPIDIHKSDNTVGYAHAKNKAITETNLLGLIIRIKYTSNGTTDVGVKATVRAYVK